ncbi:hypothetical protein Zmor_022819 [Zophobas morio]|uniref:Sialin n=1 Tax=Zophobas morio TaxID=2755281 RepID=A0AA38HZG7_9CUCU|nr:hypothetical protein Zmor_022819 [Zophobas morio]
MTASTDSKIQLDEPKPRKWIRLHHIQIFLLASIDDPPNKDTPTFPHWTEKETILSAFFWGYVIPQIGAGALVKKFGPKWFLTVTMFINSLFTILVPVMAVEAGQGGVIACRVIQGLNQGFLYPSVHTLLGKWTPLEERSKMASFVYTGGISGNRDCSSHNWSHCGFYDSPAKHGRLSEEERQYNEGGVPRNDEELPTPWRSILTSVPIIAILVAHCGQNWSFWTLLTAIPSYMNDIMKYKISDISCDSLSLFGGNQLSTEYPIADYLIAYYLSIGTVRKIFNTIGKVIPAGALIALSFVNSSQTT